METWNYPETQLSLPMTRKDTVSGGKLISVPRG